MGEGEAGDVKGQSYQCAPGDQLNFVNGGAKAIRVKIITTCGAEMVTDLHPGAEVQLIVGTSPVSVSLLNADDDYTGLRVVR